MLGADMIDAHLPVGRRRRRGRMSAPTGRSGRLRLEHQLERPAGARTCWSASGASCPASWPGCAC